MSRRTPYAEIHVPKRGIEGNNQLVKVSAGGNHDLIVLGLGVHDAESMAAIAGWKAEKKRTGLGVPAYEEARRQLESEDQQKTLHRILHPKRVHPVGQFFIQDGEEYAAFDATTINDKEGGSLIFRLSKRKIYSLP